MAARPGRAGDARGAPWGGRVTARPQGRVALDEAVRNRDWRAVWAGRGWDADDPNLSVWHDLSVDCWNGAPPETEHDEEWLRLVSLAAGDAFVWALHGWTPETARPWVAIPTPDDALRWHEAGWEPADASPWHDLDVSPPVAAAFRDAGWPATDAVCCLLTLVRTLGDRDTAEGAAPEWAAAAAGLPVDRALLLVRAGVQPDEIPAMHDAPGDVLTALAALRTPPPALATWDIAALEQHKINTHCQC